MTTTIVDPAELIDADQLAAKFRVDRATVLAWNRKNKWPHVRIGKTVLWTSAQVDQIVARHTKAGERLAETGQTKRSRART